MVHVLRANLVDRGTPVTVAFHASCHLMRELGVREEPVALLKQLSGVRLVPLDGAMECCGFGGTFSVKMAPISAAMVNDKTAAIARSGAKVLVSMDNGCLVNIDGAMKKAGLEVTALPLPLFLRDRVMV